MPTPWLIRGIVTCAAVLVSASMAPAQGTGSGAGSTSGTATGSNISSGTGSGTSSGTSSGGVGAGTSSGTIGQGFATLGFVPSNTGINTLGTSTGTTGNTGNTGKNSGSGSTPTAIPAASDPISATYSNPYAVGLNGVATSYSSDSSTSLITGFGQPAFATTTSTNQATITLNNTGVNSGGWNTLAVPKTPPYVTVLSKNIPLVTHSAVNVQRDILYALANSAVLKDKKNIALAVNGSTVFLKGQVASERERRVVEGVVRMTPGVRNVVNELTAAPQSSQQ